MQEYTRTSTGQGLNEKACETPLGLTCEPISHTSDPLAGQDGFWCKTRRQTECCHTDCARLQRAKMRKPLELTWEAHPKSRAAKLSDRGSIKQTEVTLQAACSKGPTRILAIVGQRVFCKQTHQMCTISQLQQTTSFPAGPTLEKFLPAAHTHMRILPVFWPQCP